MSSIYIPRADKVIHKNGFLLSLKIKLLGRAYLGEFGRLKYYAFPCDTHGLQVDYSHGYTDYLCCQVADCKYQIYFGGYFF